jgi:hypothetical protein
LLIQRSFKLWQVTRSPRRLCFFGILLEMGSTM